MIVTHFNDRNQLFIYLFIYQNRRREDPMIDEVGMDKIKHTVDVAYIKYIEYKVPT